MIALALALAMAAVPAKGNMVLYGYPDASCVDWVADRRARNIDSHALEGWVLGFIAGLNAFGPGSGDIAPGTNATGLLGWVDQYCAANPLDSTQQAAFKLAIELKRRARALPR